MAGDGVFTKEGSDNIIYGQMSTKSFLSTGGDVAFDVLNYTGDIVYSIYSEDGSKGFRIVNGLEKKSARIDGNNHRIIVRDINKYVDGSNKRAELVFVLHEAKNAVQNQLIKINFFD